MELIKPQKVVVERSKWVRGGLWAGLGMSCLYQSCHDTDASGVRRKCCLGFWCEAAGVHPEFMLGRRTPVTLYKGNVPELVINGRLTDLCAEMMTVNDRHGSDEKREQTLRELAASVGVELVFVD